MSDLVIEIRIYETVAGKRPFSSWLHSLKDLRGRAKIRTRIDRMTLGNFGTCKSLGDGVSELKIPFGPGYRIHYGKDGNKVVILLSGGDKSTQNKDIRLAKEYWADFQERDDG